MYFNSKNHSTKSNNITLVSNIKTYAYLGLVLGLIVLSSYLKFTKEEEMELEDLQAKIEAGIALKDHEKEKYCKLLQKVKGIVLCACKTNFISKIGSLTGYKVGENDIDLRGKGISFIEALDLAFQKTKVPKSLFKEMKWAKDINGKSGTVEWVGPGNSEVNVDAPHQIFGPDVFHIGFRTPGKDQIIGHIFLDCVPYFREQKK
jgi:hypothetical protein